MKLRKKQAPRRATRAAGPKFKPNTALVMCGSYAIWTDSRGRPWRVSWSGFSLLPNHFVPEQQKAAGK